MEEKEIQEQTAPEKNESVDTLVNSEPATPEEKKSFGEIVEDARQALYKSYKKSRTVSNISMVIIVVVAVGAVFLIEQSNKILQYVGWGLVVAAIIGMLVFYFVNRNKLPNQTKAYIKTVTDTLNAHDFSDGQFTEVASNPDEKLDHSDFISDQVYADSSSFASRAVVKGKFNGRSFSCSEAGLFKAGPKKSRTTMFVGKYIAFTNDLHFDGRYVFVNRTTKGDDLPTGLGDLAVLEQNENFIIYGKEGSDYKAVFDSLFVSRIKAIVPKDHLLNAAFVIWGGHSAAYLSYDDDVMSLPFEKPFNAAANDEYRKTLVSVLSALDLLNKD